MNEKKSGAYFAGDIKTGGDFVGGDSIKIGDISGSNVAIGRGSKKKEPKTVLQRCMEAVEGIDMLVVCPGDLVPEMSDDILEVEGYEEKYLMITPAVWKRIEPYVHEVEYAGPRLRTFNRQIFTVPADDEALDWAFTILSMVMEDEKKKDDHRAAGASISITLE